MCTASPAGPGGTIAAQPPSPASDLALPLPLALAPWGGRSDRLQADFRPIEKNLLGHIPARHPSLHRRGGPGPETPLTAASLGSASRDGQGPGTASICGEGRAQVFGGGSRSAESREKNAKGVPSGQKCPAPAGQQGDKGGSLGPCFLDSFHCLSAARTV